MILVLAGLLDNPALHGWRTLQIEVKSMRVVSALNKLDLDDEAFLMVL